MVQMADVLQPIIPQNNPTGMLQTRPTSSDTFHNIMSQHNQSQHNRVASVPRSFSSGPQHNGSATGYRSASATAPTYAFKAAPQLRSSSGTYQAQPLASDTLSAGNRQRYPGPPSVSTTSSSSSSSAPTWSQQLFSKDDSILTSNFEIAPFTAGNNPFTGQTPQTATADRANAKNAPQRYRRSPRGSDASVPTIKTSAAPSTSATDDITFDSPTTVPKTNQTNQTSQFSYAQAAAKQDPPRSAEQSMDGTSGRVSGPVKDTAHKGPTASMNRYRRRSQTGTAEDRFAAAESVSAAAEVQRPSTAGAPGSGPSVYRTDGSAGPARTFAEVARRTNGPSPLSRPMSQESQGKTAGQSVSQQSPAVAAMAALNDNPKKGVSSKLRRAFSFGSSTEFKRVTEQDAAATRAAARKEQFSSELDEEQDAIAKQQEAAGLGHNIYSGQAGFAGSTDNLSISSTASSASMMLRKMGKGMKKGGRSIKGLFRPKSVVGVPAADGPAASIGPVSLVTVEAEREKVNVNADPHTQRGGGTGFPHLERNSIDQVRASQSEQEGGRRSIVGGAEERAEVLAAVKRGILKRTATGSSATTPSGLTQADADRASPSPVDVNHGARRNGHRRTDSTTLDNDDYFNVPRFGNGSTRSLPGTPGGSRNIKFSPRIAFHEVWSATDYDRRGDIATCNRLTPMLAQQIKEELNTFKMEMEVHEQSKPHTHFF